MRQLQGRRRTRTARRMPRPMQTAHQVSLQTLQTPRLCQRGERVRGCESARERGCASTRWGAHVAAGKVCCVVFPRRVCCDTCATWPLMALANVCTHLRAQAQRRGRLLQRCSPIPTMRKSVCLRGRMLGDCCRARAQNTARTRAHVCFLQIGAAFPLTLPRPQAGGR